MKLHYFILFICVSDFCRKKANK